MSLLRRRFIVHIPQKPDKKKPVETREEETTAEEVQNKEPEIEEQETEETEIPDAKLGEEESEEIDEPVLPADEPIISESAAEEVEPGKPQEKPFINCSVSPGTLKKQRIKVAIPQAVWDNISAQSTHQYALGIKPYNPCSIVLMRVQKVPFLAPMRPGEYQITPREYPMTESCVKKDITFPSDIINNIDEEVAFNKANNLINDNRSAVITHRLLKTWFKKPEGVT